MAFRALRCASYAGARIAAASRETCTTITQDAHKRRLTSTTGPSFAASTTSSAPSGRVGGGLSLAGCWAAAGLSLAGSLAASHAVAEERPAQERMFIMIKPDGVHRALVGKFIRRFERKGFKLVGIKVVVPDERTASSHYIDQKRRPLYPDLVRFLSSGAVVAMVWEGEGVIKAGRDIIGATDPDTSAPGTIRGDFGGSAVGRNLIHGSDSVAAAQREIALWFSVSELAEYELASHSWTHEPAAPEGHAL